MRCTSTPFGSRVLHPFPLKVRLIPPPRTIRLQALANEVATSLQKARLYARTQEHLQMMTALQSISHAITASLDLDEILNNVIRLLRDSFGYTYIGVYLLEEEVLGEMTSRQSDSVTRVRRAVHAALALIDDLVELARAEAGQLDVHAHAVDARELVGEMVGEYRAQAEAAGLGITEEIPPELPLLRSDLTALESRFPIFQEFTRLEPSRTAGAGLGLAISRRVARAIGGANTLAITRPNPRSRMCGSAYRVAQ